MTDFRDRGKRIPAELLKEMRVAELGAPSLGMVERMTAIYNAIKAWEAQNNIASETKEIHICPENMQPCDAGCTGGWCVTLHGQKVCAHGKGFTDYCQPCGRINGGG